MVFIRKETRQKMEDDERKKIKRKDYDMDHLGIGYRGAKTSYVSCSQSIS
jgi:hypothetical protein